MTNEQHTWILTAGIVAWLATNITWAIALYKVANAVHQ